MSLLSITSEDAKGGKGAALPARTYRATIESAQVETKPNGTTLAVVFGNLRTKEGATEFEHNGATFRIGNRKVFARHWIDHTNPKAAEVGQSFIKKLLISTGIVAAPKNGETVQDAFDSWEQLSEGVVGKEALVLTKQRTRPGPDNEPVTESDVASYLAP